MRRAHQLREQQRLVDPGRREQHVVDQV